MAVKLVKKTTASVKPAAPVDVVKVEGVNIPKALVTGVILGKVALHEAETKVKALKSEYAKVEGPFLEAFAEQGKPAESYEFGSDGHVVHVSKARAETEVIVPMKKVAALLNAVKPDLFYELATITLGNLEKYLTPEQMAQITTSADTGKRIVKVEKAG